MKKILNVLKNALLSLFGKGPLAGDYAEVLKIVPIAIEAVRFVARATENKADDELVLILEDLTQTPVLLHDLLNPNIKEGLLRSAARVMLQGSLVDQTADSILHAAIEIALLAMKRGQ